MNPGGIKPNAILFELRLKGTLGGDVNLSLLPKIRDQSPGNVTRKSVTPFIMVSSQLGKPHQEVGFVTVMEFPHDLPVRFKVIRMQVSQLMIPFISNRLLPP